MIKLLQDQISEVAQRTVLDRVVDARGGSTEKYPSEIRFLAGFGTPSNKESTIKFLECLADQESLDAMVLLGSRLYEDDRRHFFLRNAAEEYQKKNAGDILIHEVGKEITDLARLLTYFSSPIAINIATPDFVLDSQIVTIKVYQ